MFDDILDAFLCGLVDGIQTMKGVAALVAIAVLVVGGWSFAAAYANDHTATCTVVNMDRGATSNGNSHYRVYTKECGVLADQDSILRGKFDSADVWGQIQPGGVYSMHIAGFRFGLFSEFPNILNVAPAPTGAAPAAPSAPPA